MIQSVLNTADLFHKKVFLRADLNVPLNNGTIEDDFLLNQLLPTLSILIEKNAYVVLATHLGNPRGKENIKLSTKPLVEWLINKGYKVNFARTLNHAQEVIKQACPGSIVLLENLRFYKGEQEYSNNFAEQLYSLAPDYYVNNAFSLLNTQDTSIALLPKLYPENQKSVGFLIEKEIQALSEIKYNPNKPFVVLLSGATHIKEKLHFIDTIIEKIDTLLLGPEIVFNFLKAQGKPTGKIKISRDNEELSSLILKKADEYKTEIIYPVDYLVAHESRDGTLCYKSADSIDFNDIGISIGPKTVELYEKQLVIAHNTHTVLMYGAMGFLKNPTTTKELRSLLNTIAQSTLYSMIGGGDLVAAVNKFDADINDFNIILTGDTAALAYITNQTLPGLITLN